MRNKIKAWVSSKGTALLRRAGLREGQTVVDFGAGSGNYTVAAAKVTGKKGRVYAIDKNKGVLESLKKRLKEERIFNVSLINAKGKIPLKDSSADAVLCYDIIHLVGPDETSRRHDRQRLYRCVKRVARRNALVSFYPMHLDTHTELVSEKAVRKELEEDGFRFESEFHAELIHDDEKTRGFIMNFRSA